jgi:soluble cytochrome b562
MISFWSDVMRHLRVCLLFVLIATGVLLTAVASRPGVLHAETAAPKLADHMSAIDDAMRSLRRSMRDTAKDSETLATLTTMQQHIFAAKAMVPGKIAELAEPERIAQTKVYRASMAQLLAEVCLTEKLVLEGRNDDAYESLKKLNSLKMQGHETFKVD